MRKNLNLSIVAVLVIVTLGGSVAHAKSTSEANQFNTKEEKSDVRIFVNTQQRSLYQIALLSGISVTELRTINKGDYDEKDIVKKGESIILPASSSLFPEEDKYSHPPSLRSSNKLESTSNQFNNKQFNNKQINNKQINNKQINNKQINTKEDKSDVRIFVNTQQRSLYQIALLSGISVTELRTINKGAYDEKDIVKKGESIILPASSSLLSAEVKYSYLPSLGSSDKLENTSNNTAAEYQIASALQTLGQQDWNNMSSEKIKEEFNTRTQDYAESYVRNQINNQVIDPIRSAAQDFLGRFGTAQLQFDVSDQAKLNNVNVKLFSPWYDSDNTLIFSQFTYQEYEENRRIGNFGIGQRWDVANDTWLLGYNVFFDHDFSRNHNRLGLGLEAWSDYMKLAVNYYTPLSDWKDSEDFDDYLERAARGFDVRFQGYLPSYPHLGGSLMFEQYFGDEVALFGKDNLQKNPYAVTIGVDYTPVPLFTIKGEHKQGEDANKQAKVELTMNYRIGVPLKDQLDPNMVQVARSLKGSRYDLVDRNNYIVLEYKEKKFSIDLASLGEYEEKSIQTLSISVHNANGTLSALTWNNTTGTADLVALSAGNGDLCYNRGSLVAGTVCPAGNEWDGSVGSATNDTSNWTILVPDYIDDTTGERNPSSTSGVANAGRYTFDVTLTDGSGNIATSNTSSFTISASSDRQVLLNNVTPVGVNGGAVGSSSDPAPADGTTSVFLQANLFTKSSSGSVTGFHDYLSFSEYAVAVPDAPLVAGTEYESTAPTTEEIADINALYSAKSGSSEVIFIADNAIHECPTSTPNCLLVKSIKKTVGSSTVSDDYQIEVATNVALGDVDVSLKFASYEASTTTYGAGSTPTTITFGGGKPAKITISNGSGTVVAISDNSKILTMTEVLKVGDTYTVQVVDSGGVDITTTSDIYWSLVGDNSAACTITANTILPGDTTSSGDDPTGVLAASELFNIGNTASYQVRGLALPDPSYAASVPLATTGGTATSINSHTVAGLALSGSTRTTDACAGDQGFKVRIDIN